MKILRSLNPNEILIENCLEEEINITDTDEDGNVINRNFDLYQGKTVIFRNCPKVKTIKAECLQLQGLKIENCPQLEELSAYHNNLVGLDLRQCPKLKDLNVAYNQLNSLDLANQTELESLNVNTNNLTSLELNNNSKIKSLNCAYNNDLQSLSVKHLKDLQSLDCNDCLLPSLDCGDLKKLTHLNCSNNNFTGVNKLNLRGCVALEFLDCAENNLKVLLLDNHPKLTQVSCKNNLLIRLVIKDCPALEYLDFSKQKKKIWDKVLMRFKTVPNDILTKVFISNSFNLQRVIYTEKFALLTFEVDPSFLTFKDFPKLERFNLGENDDPSFEAWLVKKQAEKEEEEQRKLREANPLPSEKEAKKTDEIPLCPWVLPTPKAGVKKIDLPHKNLTGKLIVADYPNLTFINVGNNDLEALIIRNCPKLTRLIYAHNNLREPEADISDCDNLRMENIYNNKCQGGWERPNLTEEEKKAYQSQLDQEWNQEEESESTEEEIFVRIVKLIEQIETSLTNNNLEEAERLLDELKKLAQRSNSLIKSDKLQVIITDLERRLAQKKQLITSANSNYWTLIIGSIIISLLILTIFFYYLNKQIKNKIKSLWIFLTKIKKV